MNRLKPIFEYYEVLLKLRQGIATPLQFEFTPLEPYYPLVISSLNAGYGMIEVYVIAEHLVLDYNNILNLEECKELNQKLREDLSAYFPIEKEAYVSRLSYHGMLKDITDDAVFMFYPLESPEIPISILNNDGFHVLISKHHLQGITWDKNGTVIEVQYRIDNEDTWRLANGSKFWVLPFDELSLNDGEHLVEVRLLQSNGDQISYSNTSQLTFHLLHGKAVTASTLQEYHMTVMVLLSTGFAVILLCAAVLIMRKTRLTQ